MSLRHWLSALLCAASVTAACAAPRDDRKPPVTVIGNFIDPSEADEVLFSPDGKIVMLPASQPVLWDVTSGLPLRVLKDQIFLTASAFTPNGAVFAAGYKDGFIRLWDVSSGTTRAKFRAKPRPERNNEPDEIRSLWIDAKGDLLVSGDRGGIVTIWRIATQQQVLRVLLPDAPRVLSAKLSADGMRLIVLTRRPGQADSVFDYDAHSGVKLSSYDLDNGQTFLNYGYFGDDAATIVVSGDNCARGELMLFALRDRKTLASLYKPENCTKKTDDDPTVLARVLSNAGATKLLIAPFAEEGLLLFDVKKRQADRTIHWPGRKDPANTIGASGDLTLLATREDDGIRLRNPDSGAVIKDLRSFGGGAKNIMDRDEHILLQRDPSGHNKPIELHALDAAAATVVKSQIDPGFTVFHFAAAPKLAIAGNDQGQALLLSLDTGREVRKLTIPELREMWQARLSPDGKLALVLGLSTKENADSIVRVAAAIDIENDKVLKAFEAADSDHAVTGFALSPDGKTFALGRRNGTAELRDAKTLVVKAGFAAAKEDGDVNALAFSPDGRFLIGGGMFDSDVFIWNVGGGKAVRTFDMGDLVAGYRYASTLAMSRDDKTLAAGLTQRAVSSGDTGAERGNIVVWDVATGKLRFTLRGHAGAIYALAFSADGRRIISGSLDGTIRYWDRNDGRLLATIAGTADGKWLAQTEAGFYAGSDGSDAAVVIVRRNTAIPGAQARKLLYRPDLVEQLLKGDKDGRYRDAVRTLPEALSRALAN